MNTFIAGTVCGRPFLSTVSELVSRAQAGDLASYEEIVRRFQAWAFSRAFSILGDSHLAEDAVQDAFVEAFRNLGSLLAPEAFPSWFQRIVLTACNRITRKRTLPASSLSEAETPQQTDVDPSDRIEREERDRMVHIAIQSLIGQSEDGNGALLHRRHVSARGR